MTRFTIGRTQAELSDNEYSDDDLVDYCISGMLSSLGDDSKAILYKLVLQVISSKWDSGESLPFSTSTRQLQACDETKDRNVSNRRSVAHGSMANGSSNPMPRPATCKPVARRRAARENNATRTYQQRECQLSNAKITANMDILPPIAPNQK